MATGRHRRRVPDQGACGPRPQRHGDSVPSENPPPARETSGRRLARTSQARPGRRRAVPRPAGIGVRLLDRQLTHPSLRPGGNRPQGGRCFDRLYQVVSGTASVRLKGRQVSTVDEGEVFGEVAFLTGNPRAATVCASANLSRSSRSTATHCTVCSPATPSSPKSLPIAWRSGAWKGRTSATRAAPSSVPRGSSASSAAACCVRTRPGIMTAENRQAPARETGQDNSADTVALPGGATPLRLYAHRGACLLWPENTIEAFRTALEDGANALELDVHATSDDHFVVSHDADGGRLAGDPRPIKALTLAEVRRWRLAPEACSVPTLVEVLETFPDVPMSIDLKPNQPGLVRPFVDTLIRFGAESRVTIASFHHRVMRAVHSSAWPGATALSRFEVALLRYAPEVAARRLVRGGSVQIPRPPVRCVLTAGDFSIAAAASACAPTSGS